MSVAEPAIKGAEAAQDAAQAWQHVHADPSIQYAPVNFPPVKPPETPGWIEALGRVLQSIFEPIARALGMSGSVLAWVALGLLIAFVLYVLWRLFESAQQNWRSNVSVAVAAPEWRPDQADALALLEDADRLAAAGRFDEATHLLLRRSVQQIATARPEWVKRASTAREIAAIGALPDKARSTFGLIAARVERSLFALRALDLADWQAARAAYAEFALERLPTGVLA